MVDGLLFAQATCWHQHCQFLPKCVPHRSVKEAKMLTKNPQILGLCWYMIGETRPQEKCFPLLQDLLN